MRTHDGLVGRIKQRTQRRCITQNSRLLVENQRFCAPDRWHIHQFAIDAAALARSTIRQTRQIVVHRQFGFVERTQKTVRGPCPHTVNRWFDHVNAARLERDLALGKHRVLIGLFGKVHGDPGCRSKGREHFFGQYGIARPTHKIQLARRRKRARRDQSRGSQGTRANGGCLKKAAAADSRSFFHRSLPRC
jgi:hypothetical protein